MSRKRQGPMTHPKLHVTACRLSMQIATWRRRASRKSAQEQIQPTTRALRPSRETARPAPRLGRVPRLEAIHPRSHDVHRRPRRGGAPARGRARPLPRAGRPRRPGVRAPTSTGAPPRQDRPDRRGVDRTTAADRRRLRLPGGDGRREEVRLLLLERRSAIQARTAALNS